MQPWFAVNSAPQIAMRSCCSPRGHLIVGCDTKAHRGAVISVCSHRSDRTRTGKFSADRTRPLSRWWKSMHRHSDSSGRIAYSLAAWPGQMMLTVVAPGRSSMRMSGSAPAVLSGSGSAVNRMVELRLVECCWQPIAVAGALNHGSVRRGVATHEQRNADQTFVAGHGNFGRSPVFGHIGQRDDRCGRKVDMAQGTARLVEYLSEWRLDRLEQGQPLLHVVLGKGGNQEVQFGFASSCHVHFGCGAWRKTSMRYDASATHRRLTKVRPTVQAGSMPGKPA